MWPEISEEQLCRLQERQELPLAILQELQQLMQERLQGPPQEKLQVPQEQSGELHNTATAPEPEAKGPRATGAQGQGPESVLLRSGLSMVSLAPGSWTTGLEARDHKVES